METRLRPSLRVVPAPHHATNAASARGGRLRKSVLNSARAAALLALALILQPTGAGAYVTPSQQFVATTIGVTVGNMEAQRQAAMQEAACQAGTPAPASTVAAVTLRVERLMHAYFSLGAKSDDFALGRVFAMSMDGVSWTGPDGPVAIDQLGASLKPPQTPPVLTTVVVGGDGMSARALWTVASADPATPPTRYQVEITTESGHLFDYARGLRVLHMTVSRTADAPAPPTPFCHLKANPPAH